MITKFYSSVNNGNLVEKCKNPEHFSALAPYLIKTNYLSEFRTLLEKAKARANLGIGDAQTLEWGNIKGSIVEQTDISGYINDLLSFDYEIEKDSIEGKDFTTINTVKLAALLSLKYLSAFTSLDEQISKIILNLYGVTSLDNIELSKGGVINKLTSDLLTLLANLNDSNTAINELQDNVETILLDVDSLNELLSDVTNLLKVYEPEGEDVNALQLKESYTVIQNVPKIDEDGNPILDSENNPVYEEQEITKSGGLYVKDLQPLIDSLNAEIFGESGELSVLLKLVTSNTETIESNSVKIGEFSEQIPKIVSTIENDITPTLKDCIKKDTTASLAGITSKNESISVDKPINFAKGQAADKRRYVNSYEDLLKIKPEEAWPGMEVIVVPSSTMYILLDYKKGEVTTFTRDSWKMADSLKIEVLESFADYQELVNTGKVQDDIYYYIKQQDFELTEFPLREDFSSDSDYQMSLDIWERTKEILDKLLVTGSWAVDIENRLKYKANKSEFLAYITQLDQCQEDIATLNAFFLGEDGSEKLGSLSNIIASILHIYKEAGEGTPESGVLQDKINEVKAQIAEIYSPGDPNDPEKLLDSGLLILAQTEIENIKTDLSNNYVTWELLGSESGEGSLDNPLFVYSTTYEDDKKSMASSFSTENLTVNKSQLIPIDNTLKVGDTLLAKQSELIINRTKIFDTYSEYVTWRNSSEYSDPLQEDSDYWNDWYFIVKDYEGAKPNESDFTEEAAYKLALDDWEQNTLISYAAAKTLFQPKGSYLTGLALEEIYNRLNVLEEMIKELKPEETP